jgi:hypothetical protein
MRLRAMTTKTSIILLALFALVACNRDRVEIPDELVGNWTTNELAYQDRSVKFEKQFVEVGLGQDVTPVVQKVTKVDVFQNGASKIYTIYSVDKEGPHQLTVFVDPAEGGSIFLKNVHGKWRKR